ncbi:FG-GAP repeat domain-containing protein [Streptomyces sp. NPDC002851]
MPRRRPRPSPHPSPRPGTATAAAALLCAAALLATGCSATGGAKGNANGDSSGGTDGAQPTSSSAPAGERDGGAVNRDDFNGDGHADAFVNGWYRQPKVGGDWHNNRFVAPAARGGLEPSRALRLAERYAPPDPRVDSSPISYDRSKQFTGDLDDDGYADVLVHNELSDPDGKSRRDQRIVWGGADGPAGVTKLPAGLDPVTGIGDFDGDGALDLLTLGAPGSGYEREPQLGGVSPIHAGPRRLARHLAARPNHPRTPSTRAIRPDADAPHQLHPSAAPRRARADPQRSERHPLATVRFGPLGRDRGTPRTTAELDVGYDGWASIATTQVGDFDGDGRDDLVTRASYDEEDVRFEEDMPQDVLDATCYRGTAKGLTPAGAVPGITGASPGGADGADPLAVGDFDGDGRADLLARRVDGEGVAVYGSARGPGHGRAATGVDGIGTSPDVAVGDANGDGRDDAAVLSRGKDRRVGRVAVLLAGEGGLGAGRTVTIDRYAIGLGGKPQHGGDRDFFGWDLYFADLDTDGRDELLIGTFGFNKPRKDAGYWILRGTKSGPSTTDRHFVPTKDFGGS